MSQVNWFERYDQLLTQIEQSLISLDLWSATSPTLEKLSSTMPFCVDTLELEEWLQFIFLPRMREMLAQEQLPPGPAQIAPIAEEVYKNQSDKLPLIDLLKKFDELSHVSHLH